MFKLMLPRLANKSTDIGRPCQRCDFNIWLIAGWYSYYIETFIPLAFCIFYFLSSIFTVKSCPAVEDEGCEEAHVSWPGDCYTVESPGAEDSIYTSLQVWHCTAQSWASFIFIYLLYFKIFSFFYFIFMKCSQTVRLVIGSKPAALNIIMIFFLQLLTIVLQ